MKKALTDLQLLQKYAASLGGVFTLSDLASLTMEPHKKELYRRLERLEQAGILRRFARGIYVTEGFSPRILAQKIREDSYVSFGTVLADARMIGSVPAFQIDAVTGGRPQSFTQEGLTIRYFKSVPHLMFGFEIQRGVRIALPEKALLDTLHFYQHGARFFFDVFSDITVAGLKRTRLNAFLSNYRNPKFKAFVQEYLNERGLAKHR